MKVLNLYAGIGGNRKLWNDCEVTAVEWDEETAKVYCDYFPDDKMIVGDAHQYFLDHYKEFDFIWSSPPCQTHSRARYWGWKNKKPKFPDMKLWQEIIFIQHHFEGKWIIENVKSYYDPLITPQVEIGRHRIWCNFNIKRIETIDADIQMDKISDLEDLHGFKLDGYKINKKIALRNCVTPELGLHIFNAAKGIITKSKSKQAQLF